jgi:hypothetical protein
MLAPNHCTEQAAVQAYVENLVPKGLSRSALKGNTKAKLRLRRDRKQGRNEVAAKGQGQEQSLMEVHAAGGQNGKRGQTNFRRKEFLPSVDMDD